MRSWYQQGTDRGTTKDRYLRLRPLTSESLGTDRTCVQTVIIRNVNQKIGYSGGLKLVDCILNINLEVVVGIIIIIRVERTDKYLEEMSRYHHACKREG